MKTLEKNKGVHVGLFVLDGLAHTTIFTWLLYKEHPDWFTGLSLTYITIFLIKFQYKSYFLILFSWFLIAQYTHLYRGTRFLRFLYFLRNCIFQLVLFGCVLFAISGIKNENLFSNKQTLAYLIFISIYLLISRTIYFFASRRIYQTKNRKNVIIIGTNDNVVNLVEIIRSHKPFGLDLKEFFNFRKHGVEGAKEFVQKISDYLKSNRVDFAYIALGKNSEDETINELTELLEKKYVLIGFIPNTSIETRQSLEISYLDTFPILLYKQYPLDKFINQIIKRSFDLLFTFLAFALILWWLLPLISIMVFISQGRPIFFAQKRNGLNGKEFNCYKFRTMIPNKQSTTKPTERNDPRVTKLGKILRKTSLDELPQFVNVLKGEMSIVGPRPHMVSENVSYADIIKKYSLRHYVKPGITGLAQVRGYRGAVDTDKDMEARIKTDIYYVRNWSFLLDLFIIYKTVELIIKGDENAI